MHACVLLFFYFFHEWIELCVVDVFRNSEIKLRKYDFSTWVELEQKMCQIQFRTSGWPCLSLSLSSSVCLSPSLFLCKCRNATSPKHFGPMLHCYVHFGWLAFTFPPVLNRQFHHPLTFSDSFHLIWLLIHICVFVCVFFALCSLSNVCFFFRSRLITSDFVGFSFNHIYKTKT